MPNAVNSCVANPTNIPADGATISVVTATVEDTDASVEGVDVTWTVVTGTASVDPATSQTDMNGEATTKVTATVAGPVEVKATTVEDPTGESATITAEVVVMEIVSEVTSELSTIPSDGSLSTTISTLVVDSASQQPVPDIVVTWDVSGNGEVDSATSTTDDSGIAVTNLTASKAGVITVKATTEADQTGKSIIVVSTIPLIAPTVLNATEDDNWTLDGYDIAFAVTAIIPFYTNASANHIITFNWGEFHEAFEINDPITDLPYTINVKNLPPVALDDGEHVVFYTVTDVAGNTSVSTGRTITVENGGNTPATLPAPSVPEAADGYINIQDASNGVVVDITYSDMVEGDVITLYWPAKDRNDNQIPGGTTSISHVVVAGESTYQTIIPADLFFPDGAGYEGTVTATYTVKRAAANKTELSHTTTCQIDTVPA